MNELFVGVLSWGVQSGVGEGCCTGAAAMPTGQIRKQVCTVVQRERKERSLQFLHCGLLEGRGGSLRLILVLGAALLLLTSALRALARQDRSGGGGDVHGLSMVYMMMTCFVLHVYLSRPGYYVVVVVAVVAVGRGRELLAWFLNSGFWAAGFLLGLGLGLLHFVVYLAHRRPEYWQLVAVLRALPCVLPPAMLA